MCNSHHLRFIVFRCSTHQDDERGREPARCIPLIVGSCRDSGSQQSAECRGCWARPDNLPTTNDPIQSLFCSHRCCCVAAGELRFHLGLSVFTCPHKSVVSLRHQTMNVERNQPDALLLFCCY
eukprot:scaffold95828_cov69-Cyclotella_meneghiniana.AAC.2